jgi:hypothetical protein
MIGANSTRTNENLRADSEVLSYIILAVLAAWTLVTVLVHLPAFDSRCGSWRYFAPRWGLFTGPSLLLDLELVCREVDPDGGHSDWKPVRWPDRAWWERAWSPRRRRGKLLGDLGGELLAHRRRGERLLALDSVAYGVLLDLARRHGAVPSGRRFQFALKCSSPDWPEGKGRQVYVSGVHSS